MERACVSNHQPHDCLLNRLFRRRSKKTPKLSVTGLCEGNSPVTGEFPAQWASDAENVSIRWRHHGFEQEPIYLSTQCCLGSLTYPFVPSVPLLSPLLMSEIVLVPKSTEVDATQVSASLQISYETLFSVLGIRFWQAIQMPLLKSLGMRLLHPPGYYTCNSCFVSW